MRKTEIWELDEYTDEGRLIDFYRNEWKELWIKDDGNDWFLYKENIRNYRQFEYNVNKYIKEQNEFDNDIEYITAEVNKLRS